MSDSNIEKNVNNYIDGEWVAYLKHAFSYDFNLKRLLDLAHCTSKIISLNNEIYSAPEVKISVTDNETGKLSYNSLVGELNKMKKIVGSATEEQWKTLNKNLMQYFKRDVTIYEYLSDKQCKRKGYYLDVDSGALFFFNGVKNGKRDVKFIARLQNSDNKLKLKSLFSGLYRSKVFSSSANSMKLTPNLFRDMIDFAYESTSSDLTFYLPSGSKSTEPQVFHADRDFMNVFSKLREKRTMQKKQKSANRGGELVNEHDFIGSMHNKIYFAAESYITKNSSATSPKIIRKVEMMRAIQKYLQDGLMEDFVAAVKKYDGGYLDRLWRIFNWSDEVDRTLQMVRDLKSSEFLSTALESIKKPEIKESVSDGLPVQLELGADKNFAKFESDMRQNWVKYKVSKTICLDTLNNLLEYVMRKSEEWQFPEIAIPAEIIKGTGIEQEITEESDDDDLLDNESETDMVNKMRSVDFIIKVIEITRDEVTRQKAPNHDFKEECAFIQAKIHEILSFQNLSESNIKRISEREVLQNNTIIYETDELLKTAQVAQAEDPELIVSIAKFKEHYVSVINRYNELAKFMESYAQRFEQISQNTVANNLRLHMSGNFKKFIDKLNKHQEIISRLPNSSFNFLQEDLGEPYSMVKKLFLEDLNDTDAYDKMIAILNYQTVEQPDGQVSLYQNEKNELVHLSYINVYPTMVQTAKDLEEAKFKQIEENIKYDLKSIGIKHRFSLDNVTVNKTSPLASPLASVGIFSESRDGVQYDPSISTVPTRR